jgi:hypothetical protein
MQGEIDLLQRCVYIYVQGDHFADEHEGKTQDEICQLSKKGIEFLILCSPVRLHGNNFLIKESLDMMLKITKFLKNIRFFL